ncbi:hypothetical protein KC19_VG044800 [Ceratodon purpureus]|uniref:Secreted protein n=1 Tax=Ceratodon purpureus TaxID=3225 RepID=A0A8T0HM00_CERPU|nr:hypothetical protein KC19_VG044800 [Ceratodon purpureus]
MWLSCSACVLVWLVLESKISLRHLPFSSLTLNDDEIRASARLGKLSQSKLVRFFDSLQGVLAGRNPRLRRNAREV